MDTPKLLAHALAYAERGFGVLPLHTPLDGACSCRHADCVSPAKHPRTAHGLTDASTDPDTIRGWWSMWPEANVGVAIPTGYVVVDVDVEDATTATGEHVLPATALARTGRGWQYLYRTDRTVAPRVGVMEHVDLRGPGSYVVAPPSTHVNGTEYMWVSPPRDGIANAPAWVYEASPARSTPGTAHGADIPDGGRNAELARLAAGMRSNGMTGDEIAVALAAVNGRCRPPLPDAEVKAIAASFGRYESGPRLIIGKAATLTPLSAVVLSDITPREARELRLGRWDPDDHSVLFGDGGTGKGVVAANDVARLSREGETVLILDYERHAETEWRPRVEAFGGDLDRVYVAQPSAAIWDVVDDVAALIGQVGATWCVIDSVAYACLGLEVEKSATAVRYSAALARLSVPKLSLAHTTKAEADPQHPFGSVFWSNGARITAGMSAPSDDVRLLKNRKTNQRARFATVEFDWSWATFDGDGLPSRLVERRATLTIADRAYEALARGPLSSEALLATINGDGGATVTAQTLKPKLSRSARFTSTSTGWQRAPSKGAVKLSDLLKSGVAGGGNDTSVATPPVSDNGAATDVLAGDNGSGNEAATAEVLPPAPLYRGQRTTATMAADAFAARFAAQQAAAWSSLDKDAES